MSLYEIRRILPEDSIERINLGIGQAVMTEGAADNHPILLPIGQELDVMTAKGVGTLLLSGAKEHDIIDRVISSRDNARPIDGKINHVFFHEVNSDADTLQPDDETVLQAAKEILDDPMSVAIDKIMINIGSIPSDNYASRPLVMLSREHVPSGRPLYQDRSQLLLVGWKVQNKSVGEAAKKLRQQLSGYIGRFSIEPLTYSPVATAAEAPA